MGDDNKQLIIAKKGAVSRTGGTNLPDLFQQLPLDVQKEIAAAATKEIIAIKVEHEKREHQSESGLADLKETLEQVNQFETGKGRKAKITVTGEVKTGSGHVKFQVKKGGFF